MSKLLKATILIAIICCAVVRSWYGTQLDSFTVDEPYHVVAGVSYVKTGDFRLNPEHPPLTKLWVGLFNQSTFKLRDFVPLNDKFNERNFTEEIMYQDNDDHLAHKLSRWAMWSFNGALMLCLMVLLWHLVGFHAAWFVGALLALEPTVTAHMPVVMTDLPVALALACSVLAAVGLLRNWNIKWMLILVVFSGMALSIKFSAITGLLAVFIALGFSALWYGRSESFKVGLKRLGLVFFAGVLAIMLLWSSYGFQYHAGPDGSDGFNRTLEDKFDDLASPHFQQILTTLNEIKVLPKPYIWGLADTIRAGVEGRGEAQHFIWGSLYKGEAPWFYWPSVMLAKVPVAIQILMLLGFIYTCYRLVCTTGSSNRNLDVAGLLLVLFVAYGITLMSSQGTYAGIRHALPLVLLLLLFCALAFQCFFHNKVFNYTSVTLLVLAFIMTVSEKRLWEYHNEWAGGTENAHQYFYNEGLDLGQRAGELINYIKENDLLNEDFYIGTWLIAEEIEAEGIRNSNIAEDIYDDNVEGKYSGYHIEKLSILVKGERWDPQEIAHWERIQRFGNVYLFKGSVEDPKTWATSITNRIREHLMESSEPDWHTVALRLEQVVSIKDYQYDLFLQLGNAYIKTNQREKAIAAYKKSLELIDDSKLFKLKIQQQMELLQSDVPLNQISLLRSDRIE